MTRYALLDKSGKTRLTAEADDTRTARMRFKIARGNKAVPAGWRIVKREGNPAKPKRPEFKVGDRVRVKASVVCPEYGWGEVKRGDVGVVRHIGSDGDLAIDFPAHANWSGVPSEMELAPKKEAPKKEAPKKEAPKKEAPQKLKPGHFRMHMDSGDMLEFWLDRDLDGAVNLRGCVSGESRAFYIVTVMPAGVMERNMGILLPGLQVNSDGQVLM